MTYAKPLLTPVNPETETCGCTIFVNNSSQNVFIENQNNPQELDPKINLDPIQDNTIVGVGSNGAQVTPLANTGLPGTQPIIIGVPLGVKGVALHVSLCEISGSVDPYGLGIVAFGQPIPLGALLP